MSALRDLAEITIVSDPPAGPSLVERFVSADERPVAVAMLPVGEKLAAARRTKGLTLLDVAKGVKIKVEHLVAIEAGDADALPAVPFTAGFIKAYAQFLGLDADEYATAYRHEVGAPTPPTDAPAAAPQWEAPVAPERQNAPRFSLPAGPGALASYFGIGAAGFCAAWFGVSMLPRTAPEPIRAESPTDQTAEVAATAPAITEVSQTATPETTPVQTETVVTAPAATEIEIAAAEAAPVEVKKVAAPSRKAEKPRVETPAEPPAAQEAQTTESLDTISSYEIAQAGPEYLETPYTEGVTPSAADVAISPAAQEPAPLAPLASEPAGDLGAIAAVAPATTEPQIVAASIIRAAEPVYPERCVRHAAATESVDVIFSITVQGRPVGAAVVQSSNDCFNSAAINAASDMRFAPRRIDGKPAIETAKVVTVRFAR